MSMVGFWVKVTTIDEIKTLAPLARDKLLGGLRDIDAEAERITQESYARRMSRPATGDEDASADAEGAMEDGVEHYNALFALRHGALNLLAAWLYHLFEQHVAMYKVRLKRSGEPEVELLPTKEGSKLDELRLVANVVKHGDGGSEKALRRLRPDMFLHPYLRERGIELDSGAKAPMVGEGFYVSEKDLDDYEAAVLQVWEAVIEAHGGAK